MVILSVKVVPGASRNRVAGRYGEGIKVQVSAAPEKGKANQAVIAVLAEALGVKASQIELLNGHSQPQKTFGIVGIERGQLEAKLANLK
jgi:hypothetical protein